MAKLSERIQAELDNVSLVLNEIEKLKKKKKKSTAELAGLATFIHNFYNGIENILNQILKEENITVKKSETWHKDMLKISADNKVITEELKLELTGFLAFRHFFVHAYGFMIREDDLKVLIDKADSVFLLFKENIAQYLTK